MAARFEAAQILPMSLAAAGQARRFLRVAFDDGHVQEGPADLVLLLTSELVTNAVVHARTDVTVRYCLDAEHVRVEVTDGSSEHPSLVHASPEATGGRGLMLVDALASQWGVEASQTGKTVWFEVARHVTG